MGIDSIGGTYVGQAFLCTGRMDLRSDLAGMCTWAHDCLHGKWRIHRKYQHTDSCTCIARMPVNRNSRCLSRTHDDIRDQCHTDCPRSWPDSSMRRHRYVRDIRHSDRTVTDCMAWVLDREQWLQFGIEGWHYIKINCNHFFYQTLTNK